MPFENSTLNVLTFVARQTSDIVSNPQNWWIQTAHQCEKLSYIQHIAVMKLEIH